MLQPHLVQATWLIHSSDGWAHGEMWTHPIGWEFRVYRNGELQRSQAYRDMAAAYQDADNTLRSLKRCDCERVRTAAAS
jgi:hypothetical protein